VSVIWSWPNQQVVRDDQSGPGVPDDSPDPPLTQDTDPLDGMTKDALLAYAADHGITDVDSSMTKADIRAAIGS